MPPCAATPSSPACPPSPSTSPHAASPHPSIPVIPSSPQYLRSGIETLLLGGVCAAVAYFVGQAVSSWAGVHELFAQPSPELLQAAPTLQGVQDTVQSTLQSTMQAAPPS